MRKFQEELVQKLVKLHLTPQEAKIYLLTLNNPLLSVKDVCEYLKILGPSVHRSLASLKNKGLVVTHGKRPIKIRAIDSSVVLPKLIEKNYLESLSFSQAIEDSLKKEKIPKDELRVEFLENMQEIFDHSLPLIKQAKKEILILSIGEPIPDDIFVAITRAAQTGVGVKMLAEKYDKENKEMLLNWKKNGWLVKYLKKHVLDFTLVIYDEKIAVIQIRREKEKDQRIGIAVYNPGYAKAQKFYFDELWENAQEV